MGGQSRIKQQSVRLRAAVAQYCESVASLHKINIGLFEQMDSVFLKEFAVLLEYLRADYGEDTTERLYHLCTAVEHGADDLNEADRSVARRIAVESGSIAE